MVEADDGVENGLRRALADKEILLSEIDHRMKNTLAMVAGFLSIQAARSESMETKTALRDVMRRIQGLDLAQRALTRLGALDRVDLAQFLPEVVRELLMLEGRRAIRFQLSAEPCITNVAQASALGLVVNELATNALKHAFPDGGGILNLEIHRDGERRACVIVADNGIGRPEQPHAQGDGGLGLHLAEALSRQASARLAIAVNGGTRCTLEFGLQ